MWEAIRSLLNRPSSHVAPLDGWRVLLNVSVIALHTSLRFFALLPETGPQVDSWRFHPYSGFINFSSMQVDGFLLISGLLFTSHILDTLRKNQSFISFFPKFIFNRFLRLAPAVYVYLVIIWILGDPNMKNYLKYLIFYSNSLSEPKTCDQDFIDTAGHLWSNSMELQLLVVFSLVFYLMHKMKILNGKSLIVLFLASLLVNWYYYKPGEISFIMTRKERGPFGGLSPDGRKWFLSNYGMVVGYNETKTCKDSFYWYNYMKYMYFPFQTRFGPFVMGGLISLHLRNISSQQQTSSSSFWNVLGWVLYLPCVFLFLMLFKPLPREVDPSVDLFATVASRQYFAVIFGFLVYCTLVPSHHPFHAKLLSKIMGLSFWYPFSVLSYGTYIFHFRVQYFVIYWLLKPESPEEVNMALFGKAMVVVLPLTYAVALLEYLFVEVPVAKMRRKWLSESKGKRE